MKNSILNIENKNWFDCEKSSKFSIQKALNLKKGLQCDWYYQLILNPNPKLVAKTISRKFGEIGAKT